MKVKNTLRNINPFVVKYFMNHVALRETLAANKCSEVPNSN